MNFANDTQCLLRENLKVALQDAKRLYDDGLVDDKEFKDLKAHEIAKYKEQLAAVTASAISHTNNNHAQRTPTKPDRPNAPTTPTSAARSPICPRIMTKREQPAPASENVASFSSPTSHANRPKFAADETVYVDADTYKRLKTPPIFRRRPSQKRKIIIPCAELAALQAPQEDNNTM